MRFRPSFTPGPKSPAWDSRKNRSRSGISPTASAPFPFQAPAGLAPWEKPKGLSKLIAHAKTDRVLGVHIIGPRAADMIAECVLAMEFGA